MRVSGKCLHCIHCYEDEFDDYGEYEPGYYCDAAECPYEKEVVKDSE